MGETQTPTELAAGQWLGTANRIVALKHHARRGWYANDSTGETYWQKEHPDGLKVGPQNATIAERVRLQWPRVGGVS